MSSFEEIFNFTLSYDNVKATQFDKYEKNFTFFVDGKPYKTNRIIADFGNFHQIFFVYLHQN